MTSPISVVLTLLFGLAAVLGSLVLLPLLESDLAWGVWSAVQVFLLGGVLLRRERRRPLAAWAMTSALLLAATWGWLRFGPLASDEPTLPEAAASAASTREASAAALAEGLRLARASLATLDGVRDYTCTLAKRERAKNIAGREHLTDAVVEVKIRHEPFSVYVKYVAPEARKGTEAIYVEGQREGKVVAHSTRVPFNLMGTLRLDPEARIARIDHRYPITKAGLRNGLEEFLARAERDKADLAACDVRIAEDVRVDDRPCRTLEITNPKPGGTFATARARLAIDVASNLPVLIEHWEYADVDGERKARLVESYTTTGVVLDPGLGDIDFDPDNPAYGYK
jgi:hypothetical protein